MDGGVNVTELEDYLIALNFDKDASCSINCEYWEKSTGEYVIFSIDSGGSVAPFMLKRILDKIGKTQTDFNLFILNKKK